MPSVLGVIPVRMAASRFPGKPLLPLGGRTIVEWVWQRARTSTAVDRVVIATPDDEIIEAAASFGAEAVRTSSAHETGTDRVAEAAVAAGGADVVLNIQGDQPFVSHDALEALVRPFEADPTLSMSTVGIDLDPAKVDDPNTVRVVLDRRGRALYFSRASIPYFRVARTAPVLHHIGLYGFSRAFLATYATLESTPLEQCEALEQLRALEHGFDIHVERTTVSQIEINTPDDLVAAERFVKECDGDVPL